MTLVRPHRLLAAALALAAPALRADHGPGTSGGGLSVPGGEVLKAGRWSLEWRTDLTTFKGLSDGEIAARAGAGEVDLLDRSLLHTLTAAWGFREAFQVSASLGWYTASGGAHAEVDPDTGEVEHAANHPSGPTDLWLQGKWAAYKGPAGRFAVFAGLKLPTGRWDLRDDAGEPVDLAATPGSGAVDGQLGVGYSTYLTPRWTLDAGASHTWHGTKRDTRLGARTDAGVAVACRFTEDVKHTPGASAFLELNWRHLEPMRSGGEAEPNSGGTALFATPGLRIALTPHATLTLAAALPLRQDLRGVQVETRLKASAALAWVF